MIRMFRRGAMAMITILACATASQAQTICNPYEAICMPGGSTFNPYVHPPAGGHTPFNPYTNLPPMLHALPEGFTNNTYAQRWAINGELILNDGDNRFGWLIVENLEPTAQAATVEFASEAWPTPAYRVVQLEPKARVAVGLHGELPAGIYFAARAYFEAGGGTIHATLRPHAGDTIGQHDVPGAFVPRN